MADPRTGFSELLTTLLQTLVDTPNEVAVKFRQGDQTTVYEIRCAKSDVGKVLGKKGSMVMSLRKILQAYATKHGFRGVIEVIE